MCCQIKLSSLFVIVDTLLTRLVAQPCISRLQSYHHNHHNHVTCKTASIQTRHQSTSTQPPIDCPGCGAPFQTTDENKPGYLVNQSPARPIMKKQSNKSMSDAQYKAALEGLDAETLALLEGQDISPETEPEIDVPEKTIICQRCHKLKHNNKLTTESSPQFLRETQQYGSLDFLKTKQNPLVVAIIDLIDLPSSLEPVIKMLSGNSSARVILAANKFDLLPKTARLHEQRLRDWIVHQAKLAGLPTQQIQWVSLISARKGWGVSGLIRRLESVLLPTDDIYMVGCTNAGKSALVNQMLSQAGSKKTGEPDIVSAYKANARKRYKITSSAIPGTTMGTIKVPLRAFGLGHGEEGEDWMKRRFITRDRFLIDTPGIINDHQLVHRLSPEDQNMLNKTELTPITFRLQPSQSLLLKPLVRIDLMESSEPVMMTVFSPLEPHVTKTAKLPMDSLVPTIKPNSSVGFTLGLRPLDKTVRVLNCGNSLQASADLSFAGGGWVAVAGKFNEADFKIWLPNGVDSKAFEVRDPPMLPFEYKGNLRKFFGSGHRVR
ncbi:hypothetical protein CLU79DRAFT_765952 [Phycomyces nitens]|nr:hypothetical protein CLU79DRAFT_765952 [Phycomyces nitens]